MACGAGVDEHGLYDVYVHIGYLGGETSSDRAHEGPFGRMQAFFWRVGGGLLLLCIARMMLGGSALVGLLFAPLFVLLTALLLENKGKVRILAFFGRHSTNMWLVHFFFIKYIFVGQIYQLHYPLLIYGVLVGVSVFVSILVQKLYAPIQRYIRG